MHTFCWKTIFISASIFCSLASCSERSSAILACGLYRDEHHRNQQVRLLFVFTVLSNDVTVAGEKQPTWSLWILNDPEWLPCSSISPIYNVHKGQSEYVLSVPPYVFWSTSDAIWQSRSGLRCQRRLLPIGMNDLWLVCRLLCRLDCLSLLLRRGSCAVEYKMLLIRKAQDVS